VIDKRVCERNMFRLRDIAEVSPPVGGDHKHIRPLTRFFDKLQESGGPAVVKIGGYIKETGLAIRSFP
jgi:hypothetical protein